MASPRSLNFSLSILNTARAAVQSERATRSEAPSSTSKNRLTLARPAAASIRGKHRGEAGIHFASLAARGRLPRRPPNVRTRLNISYMLLEICITDILILWVYICELYSLCLKIYVSWVMALYIVNKSSKHVIQITSLYVTQF
jgi:hypothetical protein